MGLSIDGWDDMVGMRKFPRKFALSTSGCLLNRLVGKDRNGCRAGEPLSPPELATGVSRTYGGGAVQQ
jgi:hypothetical protein